MRGRGAHPPNPRTPLGTEGKALSGEGWLVLTNRVEKSQNDDRTTRRFNFVGGGSEGGGMKSRQNESDQQKSDVNERKLREGAKKEEWNRETDESQQ